jgi:hypothetical protein
MNPSTRLEPLSQERASELQGMLQRAGENGAGLALDGRGQVLGVVAEDDAQAEHLLGDLDVHA